MYNIKDDIIEWLNDYCIENYTINDDLTVDVNEYICLQYTNISLLPIQFGVINNSFYCRNNSNLKSLKGVS